MNRYRVRLMVEVVVESASLLEIAPQNWDIQLHDRRSYQDLDPEVLQVSVAKLHETAVADSHIEEEDYHRDEDYRHDEGRG